MNTDLTIKANMEAVVKKKMVELQATEYPSSLVCQKPEKWWEIATSLLSGVARTKTHQNTGCDYQTVCRVHRQLIGEVEEYKKWKIEHLRDTQDMADELIGGQIDKKLQSSTREGAEEIDAKDLYYLDKVSESVARRLNRLEGGADLIVERRVAKTPAELKADFDEMFAEIEEAEVIYE